MIETRIGWEAALAALLLSFVLSMAVAWVYAITYQGVGYLRGFTHTLALGGVVSALVMLAIGDDIARGLGLVGALTLIRFRATLKDTRDLIFVFASLTAGVACGVQAYTTAVIGTGVFLVAMLCVSWSSFGSRRQFDAVLRFRLRMDQQHQEEVAAILRKRTRSLALIHLREVGGDCQEHSYQLRLAGAETEPVLLQELGGVTGLSGLTLLRQENMSEM